MSLTEAQPEVAPKAPQAAPKAETAIKNLNEKDLFKQAKELGKNASASLTFANLLKLAASAQHEFDAEKFLQAFKSGTLSVDGEDEDLNNKEVVKVFKQDISRIKAAMNLGIQAGDDAEKVIDNIMRGRKLAMDQKVLAKQKDGTNVRLPHHLYESILKVLNGTRIPVPGANTTIEVTVDLLTGREETVGKGKKKVTFNPEGLKKWSVLLAIDITAGGGYEWNEETKVWDLLPEPPKPEEPEAPANPVQAQPEKDETVSPVDASPAPQPSQNDDGSPQDDSDSVKTQVETEQTQTVKSIKADTNEVQELLQAISTGIIELDPENLDAKVDLSNKVAILAGLLNISL
jgi:hypothetical protein